MFSWDFLGSLPLLSFTSLNIVRSFLEFLRMFIEFILVGTHYWGSESFWRSRCLGSCVSLFVSQDLSILGDGT